MNIDGHRNPGVLQPARIRNLTVIDTTTRRQLIKKPPITFTAPRPLSIRRYKDDPILASPRSSSFAGGNGLLDGKSPGKFAAAQRVQDAMTTYAGRKMMIADYGGEVDGKVEGKAKAPVVERDSSISSFGENLSPSDPVGNVKMRRCSFITPNSDPLYVKYHDEEWGVPVHEDERLFELLTLTAAQVWSDWTTILKKRDQFRSAFAGFDPEHVSAFSEDQIVAVSRSLDIDLNRVRRIVVNSVVILEIKKTFGSLDKYLWMFVNDKPISPKYSSCRKIPVKTSKSVSISKDMVRRGFPFAGPTVIHLFMQAAGLTNDHIVSCSQHTRLEHVSTKTC